MKFKAFLLLFFLLINFTCVIGQKSEIGFGIGTFNYTGDLARNFNLLNSKPAGTAFYRANLSKVVSFRAALTAGKLGAKDKRQNEVLADQRNASFNIFLMDASTVMEYHFLNWRSEKRILRFTPYLFGGLGLFGMAGAPQKADQYSNVQG